MVSLVAVIAVLLWEQDKIQKPIYYVSQTLHDTKTRYTRLEKLIFILVIAAQRLRPYFQVHLIAILIDQPLKIVLHRSDTSGQLAKWVIELTKFEMKFQPQPSIKV